MMRNRAGRVKVKGKVLSRRARRVRLWTRLGVLGLLLLGAGVVVVTQGPVPRWIAAAVVRKATGAQFEAKWVSLKLDGRLVIEEPRFLVPGGEGVALGEAGEILRAERVEIVLDLSALTSLQARALGMTVRKPVMRISQHAVTSELNLAKLKVQGGDGGSTELPAIDVEDAVIELGEHGVEGAGGAAGVGGYRMLVSLPVAGRFSPSMSGGPGGVAGGQYQLRVRQTGGEGLGRGGQALTIDGAFDLVAGAGEFSSSSIDLNKWPAEKLPSALRETWRSLNMRGDIAGVRTRFSRNAGVSTELELQDVELNLPIAAGRPEVVGKRTARLERVSGRIRLGADGIDASVDGTLEDLAINVKLRSQGLSADAPYNATLVARDFLLEKDPRLLWFTPPVVRKNLDTFSSPTAVLDAQIDLARGTAMGDVAAPVAISGTIVMRNGAAAFENFPYPITNLRGKVRFDEDQVEIISLQGSGPTGASLLAEGRIAPINDESGLDLRITLTDLPIDEELRKAMDSSIAAGMLDLIFSRKQYAQLLEAGLLATPGQHAEAKRELERQLGLVDGDEGKAGVEARGVIKGLRKVQAKPAFAMGGEIERVDIRVSNDAGPSVEYRKVVDVRFKQVGVVPSAFGYPLIADDMNLRVNDRQVTLTAKSLRGLSGGVAEIWADIPVSRVEADGVVSDGEPKLRIAARGMPIDQLLLTALPRTGEIKGLLGPDEVGPPALPTWADPDPPVAGVDVRQLLMKLGIAGKVDCDAVVGSDLVGPGKFDVTVRFDGLRAMPEQINGGQPSRVALSDLAGSIRVGGDGIQVDSLTGRLVRLDEEPVGPPEPGDTFAITAEAVFGELESGKPGELDLRVKMDRFDLASPVEDLLAPLAPGAAKRVQGLRESQQPVGRISAEIAVFGVLFPTPQQFKVRITGIGAEGVGVKTPAGEVTIDQTGGKWVLSAFSAPRGESDRIDLDFEKFTANLWQEKKPVAELIAQGGGRLTMPAREEGAAGAEMYSVDRLTISDELTLGVRNARLDSGLLRLFAKSASATLEKQMVERKVTGLVDADVRLYPKTAPLPDAHVTAVTSVRQYDYEGAVRPREVAFDVGEERVEVARISGQATFTPLGGAVEQLTLSAERWELRADGPWRVTPTGYAMEQRLWLDAGRLEPALLVLMPGEVRGALEDAKIALAGGVEMRAGELSLETGLGDSEGRARADFNGMLRFSELSADVGFPVRRASGQLGILVHSTLERGVPEVTLSLSNAALVAGPITLGQAQGRVEINPVGEDGVIRLRGLSGTTNSGRVTIAGELMPPVGETPRRYNVRMDLAGVRFADLLRDIKRNSDITSHDRGERHDVIDPAVPVGLPVRVDGPGARVVNTPGDMTRGSLDAQLSVSGLAGRPESRTGRGELRVVGGDVISVPFAVPMLKLTALRIPTNESLDFFQASFTLDGQVARFTEMGLLSGSVAILGTGTLTLPDAELDLRFATRAPGGVPLLGDLLDGLRNQIITTTVGGTLDDPKIGATVLSRPRAFFASIFGSDAREVDVDPVIEQKMRRERERLLPQGPKPAMLWLPEGWARVALAGAGVGERELHQERAD